MRISDWSSDVCSSDLAIWLRIPGWARDSPAPGGLYRYADRAGAVRIAVNGTPVAATPDPSGYVTLDRVWRQGDAIEIDFPFTPRRILADPRVREAARRAAITRGPIVYCVEWPDAPRSEEHTA